jgi:hypothetical protein
MKLDHYNDRDAKNDTLVLMFILSVGVILLFAALQLVGCVNTYISKYENAEINFEHVGGCK